MSATGHNARRRAVAAAEIKERPEFSAVCRALGQPAEIILARSDLPAILADVRAGKYGAGEEQPADAADVEEAEPEEKDDTEEDPEADALTAENLEERMAAMSAKEVKEQAAAVTRSSGNYRNRREAEAALREAFGVA